MAYKISAATAPVLIPGTTSAQSRLVTALPAVDPDDHGIRFLGATQIMPDTDMHQIEVDVLLQDRASAVELQYRWFPTGPEWTTLNTVSVPVGVWTRISGWFDWSGWGEQIRELAFRLVPQTVQSGDRVYIGQTGVYDDPSTGANLICSVCSEDQGSCVEEVTLVDPLFVHTATSAPCGLGGNRLVFVRPHRLLSSSG